ncbi:MAG: hypothetical protein QW465_03005 [Candidatus Anstonellales archaeon]
MCELLYIYSNISNTYVYEIEEILKDMYSRNPDGIGGVFDRASYSKNIDINDFIEWNYNMSFREAIFHTRKRTRGEIDLENTQPIIGKRFWVMHNGGFRGIGQNGRSDSWEFTRLLDQGTDLVEYLTNREGAWSMFILDTYTKDLIYTRNHKRSMFMAKNNKYTIAATKDHVIQRLLDILEVDLEIHEIPINIVFVIEKGEFIPF